MTYTTRTQVDGKLTHVVVQRDGRPLSFGDALAGWRTNEAFREFFLTRLAESSSPAYLWETPPITQATLDRPFEFVLVDAPTLAHVAPESRVFHPHFASANEGIATFDNLGHDALLVAPAPPGDYPHLAAFTRSAPVERQHSLWRAVGAAAEERLGDEPLWISTSGLGVFWLHVRLDSFPKYYTHAPYRDV
jgi:hypothetical protein